MSQWYQWDSEKEDFDTFEQRKFGRCPLLDDAERLVLHQCRMTIWDGNVASKAARDSLVKKGLVTRYNGWQVVTQEGMAVLDVLGELRDDRWPKPEWQWVGKVKP